MRLSLINFVVALLIAVLAIGAPIPAKADCAAQGVCKTDADDMTGGACGGKGEPCKVAQNCAVQPLKMPTQATIGFATSISKVAFAAPADETLASAFIIPETAPPRV